MSMEVQKEDSIQVIIRVRPGPHTKQSASFVVLTNNEISIGRNTFAFDKVFGPSAQQEDLFEAVGAKVVANTLEGYNSCVFAYGQTGSGKTHTMIGGGQGIVQRSFDLLFLKIASTYGVDFVVTCSYFEIYNQQLVDLLDQSPKKLTVREDIRKGVFVENLTEEPVEGAEKALELLNQGIRSRHIGETLMNRESSRSHAVFTLHIQSKQQVQDSISVKESKMHFVDLAGSERQKSTAAVGQRLKEASNINKSLTTLGMVINSLSGDKSRTHVPFRDSKLTFVLRDSLGGNSKTFIIATVADVAESFQETLSTLKFAQRAKMVKLRAQINQESVSGNIAFLKSEIRRLKDQLFRAKQQLAEERMKGYDGKSHYGELIISSYNRNVDEINNKISQLMSLLPAVIDVESPLNLQIEMLRNHTNQGSLGNNNALMDYLTNNNQLLNTINQNINTFLELKQEIRAKASVEKLRFEDLRTPLKMDRQQIEQMSMAKNAQLNEAKKTILDLKNQLADADKVIETQAKQIKELKVSGESLLDQNRYLKEYYEAKQTQLLLEIQKHTSNVSLQESEYIQSLLSANRRLMQESSQTITNMKSELAVKTHEIEMLSKHLVSNKKTINQLTADKQAAEDNIKSLSIDLSMVRDENSILEERLQLFAKEQEYLQKSLQDLLVEKAKLEEQYRSQMESIKEQAKLAGIESSNKLTVLTESNNELTSEIDILTQTLQFKNTRVQSMTQELNTKNLELEQIQRNIAALQNSLNEESQKNVQNLIKIQQLQNAYYSLESLLKEKCLEIETLNINLIKQRNAVQELEERLQSLIAEKLRVEAELSTQIGQLTESLSTFNNNNAELNEEICVLKLQHQSQLAQVKLTQEVLTRSFQQKTLSLTNEIEKLTQRHNEEGQQYKSHIQTLTKHLETTTAQAELTIKQLSEQLILQQKNQSDLQHKISSTLAQLQTVTSDYNITKDKLVACQSTLTATTEQKNREEQVYVAKISEHSATMEKLTQQITLLEAEILNSQPTIESLQSNVQFLTSCNNKLNEEKQVLMAQHKSDMEAIRTQFQNYKANTLSLQESKALKSKLNEAVVENYKLRNMNKNNIVLKNEDKNNVSRLEAKIAYYEEKFNLMKIEYTNSTEAVRKLKQREIEIKEENAKLQERLNQVYVESGIKTKTQIEEALVKENEELKATVAQLRKAQERYNHSKKPFSMSDKENYQQQLQTVRKQKENLNHSIVSVRQRLSAMVNSMADLFGEEAAKEANMSIKDADEGKHLLKCLGIFEEMLKKKEAYLAKNIKREEKLKSQNCYMIKENIYLKEKLRDLETGDNVVALERDEGKRSVKKVKK